MLLFDLFLILKKLSHSIRRSIVGKQKLHERNYRISFDKIPKKIPHIIWIYWDKPVAYAPEIVLYAVSSWKKKNPSWDVRVLSDSNVGEFVDLPPHQMTAKFNGGPTSSESLFSGSMVGYGSMPPRFASSPWMSGFQR
ncbi:capsular polysaccharide synthesis protein [Sinorhizobium medicae]|uniref:capsular polysaccharide synthesis protein n=1 Tax=Sinorhizobium medicae TaxID=110321 RepID=UPI0022866648|nr:capsular polysaccharide synthesis protein [Sinorhizobium medicae]